MNVAIITSGYLPVPPTKGGAVESIINNLINENEKYSKCDFVVYSIYDDCAAQFNSTKIKYLRTSKVAAVLDYLTYFLAKNILRRKHLISYRYVFQRMEFLRKVGKDISKNNYDRIVLENNVVMF